jgi:hypothetical protein
MDYYAFFIWFIDNLYILLTIDIISYKKLKEYAQTQRWL